MGGPGERIVLPDGWEGVIYREWSFPPEVIETWNTLALQYGDAGIFVSHAWFENWWKAFGQAGELFIVTISKNDVLHGIFPCRVKKEPVNSLGVSILSLTNDHTCHYDFLTDNNERQHVLLMFIQLVYLHNPKAQMHFDFVSASSPNTIILTQLLSAGRIPFHQYMRPWSPWLRIDSDAERFHAQLPGRLRHTISRCRKKAEKLGYISFEVHEATEHIDKVLDVMFDVESKGWKGRSGTAIKCNTATEKFYRGYAYAAMGEGRLLLFALKVNGSVIAADYCLRSGSTVFLIKTGYDEMFSQLAPGNLLRYEIFSYLAGNNSSLVYNFLGMCEPWKMEWTQETNECGWIKVYQRSLKGWGQYAIHYGWKNVLKRTQHLGASPL